MFSEHLNRYISICLIMAFCKKSTAFYSFQCPVQANWKHRVEAVCDSGDSYFCLYDKNQQTFNEFCRKNPDFEAPGQKLIVAGSFQGTLQGADCDINFYQPFQFLSSGNSRCVYKKSYCSEEGQIISSNGTLKYDRLCRCDYTRCYDFMVKPKHRCYCLPSEEDCSCYLKLCSSNQILSPDYECLDKNEWKTSFKCDPIVTVILPQDTGIPSTVIPWFGPYLPANYDTGKCRKIASFTVIFLISSIIIMLFFVWIRTLKCFSLRLKDHSTDFQKETLRAWISKLGKFVITKATKVIYNSIQANNVIVIVGPTGAGKSANAYHVAFRLKEECGYTVIPARQSIDITNYYIPDTKQIFIIDDFIGKYAVDETDMVSWEKNEPLLKMMFNENNHTKLILTIRTYVWQPEWYKCLSFNASCACDLLSDEISLSLTERWGICSSYLKPIETKVLNDKTISMYNFHPSLCSTYASFEKVPVGQFFTVPYWIINEEINNFKIKSQVFFIALAILAIKQTISKNSFSIDNHESDELFQDVFHESAFLQYPSKNLLKSSLASLAGTYVKDESTSFMFINETMQNIVLHCISKTLIKSVIKYCKTKVILNQFRLECVHEQECVCNIKVTEENEDAYFQRLVLELAKGKNKDIFENEQNKYSQFRNKFLKNLKKHLSRTCWTQTLDGMTSLHVVSSLGYEDYASFFIQNKTMINQKDSAGNIPLHLACMIGQKKIVQNLVEKKSFIDIANNEGLKPFFYACENNAIQVTKYLLHHSAKWINVDEKYHIRNNGSVLHIASANDFVNIVVVLLDNKAVVNVQDGCGCTPLHLATNSGHPAVVKALLDFNANINIVDSLGRSPLYFACSANQERVVNLLIEKNACINQKTINGLRPLHAACQFGSIGIVKILLEKGAKINSSKPRILPLHKACTYGKESIINLLIASNASVNHKTKDGVTPLHEACINGRANVAQILLDNKANVNEANKDGCTALFFSCAGGFRTVVDLLLQHGANVNICDEEKVSPLMIACKEDHTDVVDSLLRSGSNVNHYDKDNCSSLLFACKTGNVDMVNVLLKYGADINLADKDMISPLHTACMYDKIDVVMTLIENKANVNTQDTSRQTPLFKSSTNGYTSIVDLLLSHGASIEIYDSSGISPLAIAEKKGHTTVVDVLRQYIPNNYITENKLQNTVCKQD